MIFSIFNILFVLWDKIIMLGHTKTEVGVSYAMELDLLLHLWIISNESAD